MPSAYARVAKEDGIDIHPYIPDGMHLSLEELNENGERTPKELSLCMKRGGLYGLRQAGRVWHELLHATLTNIGYVNALPSLVYITRLNRMALRWWELTLMTSW